jgi:hypothetical protein
MVNSTHTKRFREPLQFIVMSVMAVMGIAFPYTYGVF